MINWSILLPLLITTFVAIAGWVIAHRFNGDRDLHNKRRETRIVYLIEAYRRIERGAVPEAKAYKSEDFESAIADIQLFGSAKQVELAFQFAESTSRGDTSSFDFLLAELRDDLRKELELGVVDKPIRPFRILEKQKASSLRRSK